MKKIYSKSLVLIVLFLIAIVEVVIGQVENVGNDKFAITVEGNTLKIPIYTNHDLLASNPIIEKAIIVIHGTNRNADDYFENMEIAANSVADRTNNMLIVAPQFLTETDIDFHGLDEEHLYWTSGGWKSGSNSRNEDTNPRPARIPSYAVLDSLLLHVTGQFPNLKSIVFTGHSAGGQVAQRLAATSPITHLLCENFGVSIRYVVANPSSYVYMDDQRKLGNSTTEFGFPTNFCTDYNEWKYGLEELFTYPQLVGIPTIRDNYKKTQVTYLLGEEDNDANSSSLDTDCAAELQGEHRLERGMVYYNYLQHYYGTEITATHDLVTVPRVGHNNFEMYNSHEGIEVLFRREANTCGSTVPTKEVFNDFELTIFPNPSSDVLTIQLPVGVSEEMQFTVFDLQGRQMLTGKASNFFRLNVSHLTTGIYFLKATTLKAAVYQRFMVN